VPAPVIQPRPVVPSQPTTPVVTPATVREAEKLLKLAGFSPGQVDGRSSPALEAALKSFQSAWGLAATGVADAATMAKLRHTGERVRAHKGDQFVSVGQRSGDIKTIEQRLEKLGYDVGKVDGVFSRETFAAVKAFKADQPDIKNDAGAIAKHGRAVLAREAHALEHARSEEHTSELQSQSRSRMPSSA
jgi:peptidoglycan hydrolase-like protein with peptidoglycan-binding domain